MNDFTVFDFKILACVNAPEIRSFEFIDYEITRPLQRQWRRSVRRSSHIFNTPKVELKEGTDQGRSELAGGVSTEISLGIRVSHFGEADHRLPAFQIYQRLMINSFQTR